MQICVTTFEGENIHAGPSGHIKAGWEACCQREEGDAMKCTSGNNSSHFAENYL